MDISQLINYIASPDDYIVGVGFFEQFCNNKYQLKRFRKLGPTKYNKKLLLQLLIKKARYLEKRNANLKKKAPSAPLKLKTELSVSEETNQDSEISAMSVDLAILPPELRKLHFKKGKLYIEASRLHRQLEQNPQHKRAAMVEQIVENMRENQEIWKELNYFATHKQIAGNHPDLKQPEQPANLEEVPPHILQKTLTNRRSNLSRYKKLIADNPDDEKKNEKRQAKIDEWASEIKAIEDLLKNTN